MGPRHLTHSWALDKSSGASSLVATHSRDLQLNSLISLQKLNLHWCQNEMNMDGPSLIKHMFAFGLKTRGSRVLLTTFSPNIC